MNVVSASKYYCTEPTHFLPIAVWNNLLCDETREENDGAIVIRRVTTDRITQRELWSCVHQSNTQNNERMTKEKEANTTWKPQTEGLINISREEWTKHCFIHKCATCRNPWTTAIISLYFQTVLGYKYRQYKHSCGQTTITVLFSPDNSYFKSSPWATQRCECTRS